MIRMVLFMSFFTLSLVTIFIYRDKNDGYHNYPERKNIKIERWYSVNGGFKIENWYYRKIEENQEYDTQ